MHFTRYSISNELISEFKRFLIVFEMNSISVQIIIRHYRCTYGRLQVESYGTYTVVAELPVRCAVQTSRNS